MYNFCMVTIVFLHLIMIYFINALLLFIKGSVKFWLKNEIAFNFLLLIGLSRVRRKTIQVELEGKCEMKTIFVQISETIPQKMKLASYGI